MNDLFRSADDAADNAQKSSDRLPFFFPPKSFFKNFSKRNNMPRHKEDRPVSERKWFIRTILEVPERRRLFEESVPGDERWLKMVRHNEFPRWALNGRRKTNFKCRLRKIVAEFNSHWALYAHQPTTANTSNGDIAQQDRTQSQEDPETGV